MRVRRVFAAGLATLSLLAKTAPYPAIAVLAALHYDFWFWDDPTLAFGFLPVGMAYHLVYTMAASALWYLASRRPRPGGAEDGGG